MIYYYARHEMNKTDLAMCEYMRMLLSVYGTTHMDTLHDDAMIEDDNSNVSKGEGGYPPIPGTDEGKEM